ncbi:MAG: type II secretion system major pseudopilin GspG [Acidobacteriota bacterium]
MNRKRKPRAQRGFSLIELIVVLVIMGLLAGVVGPAVVRRLQGSRGSIAKQQIAEFESALELYHFDIGRYPTTSEGLNALIQNPGSNTSWSGPYLKKAVPKDPWNKEYVYRSPGQHGDFDLLSLGADGVEGGSGNDADLVNWSQ